MDKKNVQMILSSLTLISSILNTHSILANDNQTFYYSSFENRKETLEDISNGREAKPMPKNRNQIKSSFGSCGSG